MSQAVVPRITAGPVLDFNKVEAFCVGLVVLNQVLGFLAPPESFVLNPAAYAAAGSSAYGTALSYPITSVISHAVQALVALLLCRHWRSYLGLIGRGAPIFIQIAIFMLSTLWSASQADSLRASLHLFIYYVLAIELVRSYTVIELARLLVRLFAIVALTSYLLLLVFPTLGHDIGTPADWRGAVANKNSFGATCSIAVLVCGYSMLVGANKRAFAMFVLLANLVLVVGARSATSLIASVICLGLLFGLYAFRRPGGKFFMFLCSLGVLFFLAAALSSVEQPAALLGKTATLTGRTDVWQAVEQIIKSRPLTGYGIGFWVVDTDYRNDIFKYLAWQPPHAHNDFLDVMLQTGAIGAFAFIFNYVVGLCLGLRRLWRLEDGYLFCTLMILNFAIRGITETVSLPPGDLGVTLLYAGEIYLWKLSFTARASKKPEARGIVSKAPRPYKVKQNSQLGDA